MPGAALTARYRSDMEPMSIIAVAKAAAAASRAWKEADAKVAALAKERGVPKEVIWAEIQARR